MAIPSDTVDVYGVGDFGQRLAASLAAGGIAVRSFVDRRTPAARFDAPFRSLDSVENWDLPVVLGICNPQVDIVALAGRLRRRGAQHVLSPVSAAIELHGRGTSIENYWLTGDVDLYVREAEAIQSARASLADAKSQAVFDSILRYRSSGDLGALRKPEALADQYFPADIPFVTDRMRYVDAGAFDGDTIRALRGRSCDVEALIALEPDEVNFPAVVESLSGWSGAECVAMPIAIAEKTKLASFDPTGTSAASLSSAGMVTVQCASLDDLLATWRPTHIKMDIEGGEIGALAGMQRVLSAAQPRMAIATYHRPADMWALINSLAESLDHLLLLRSYAHQTFETVLYAVPPVDLSGR